MNNTIRKNENKRDINWEFMYQLAKAYYEYHGNLDILSSFQVEGYEDDKITRLGRWIDTQRQVYKKGKLSRERIEKLEKIGMIWKKKTTVTDYKDYKDYEDWDKLYGLVYDYFNTYGDLNIPEKYVVNGYRLGFWLSNQKIDYIRGNLSDDKIDKLNKLKIVWKNNKGRSRR